MVIGLFLVFAAVLVFLIERFVKNQSVRFVLVFIVWIAGVVISVNVGMTVGRSLEENRSDRNLMLIFSSLRDYEEEERDKVLDELKQRLSDGGEPAEVENLLNYLEWEARGGN